MGSGIKNLTCLIINRLNNILGLMIVEVEGFLFLDVLSEQLATSKAQAMKGMVNFNFLMVVFMNDKPLLTSFS